MVLIASAQNDIIVTNNTYSNDPNFIIAKAAAPRNNARQIFLEIFFKIKKNDDAKLRIF